MNRYTEQPDIMAIGDSLYQGVHSLSFPAWMAAHSAPAQVARAIGMPMVVPDLTQPLLWDLTEEVRDDGIVGIALRIARICRDNLQHWKSDQPWSAHEAFDNVSIGGATIKDLWTVTDDSQWQHFLDLSRLFTDTDPSSTDALKHIGPLFVALATCYTLNPRHRPEQRAKSQLDQANDRAPRILLINIGSNEGLFDACFMGNIHFQTQQGREAMRANAEAINALVRELAPRLKALPNRVEKIVFNGLIRPRAVPNLMPSNVDANDFPGDDYFAAYGPRLTGSQQPISGAALREYDDLIAEVNATSRDTLHAALGNRVTFADLYPACPPIDGKHYFGRGLSIPGAHVKLDNRPITSVIGGFTGGFGSLDSMHPSIPGYAVLADVVLDALGRTDVRTDKLAAFQADRLLSDFPGVKVLAFQAQSAFILSLVRLFGRGRTNTPMV